MKERVLTTPDIALIAVTRVALGAGIGLLLAEKMNEDRRKGAGWALLAVGVWSSIPLGIKLRSQSRALRRGDFRERRGERLEPAMR